MGHDRGTGPVLVSGTYVTNLVFSVLKDIIVRLTAQTTPRRHGGNEQVHPF